MTNWSPPREIEQAGNRRGIGNARFADWLESEGYAAASPIEVAWLLGLAIGHLRGDRSMAGYPKDWRTRPSRSPAPREGRVLGRARTATEAKS